MFGKKRKSSGKNGYFELGVVYNDYQPEPVKEEKESNEAIVNSIREYVNQQEKNEYRANLLFNSMDDELLDVPESLVYKREDNSSESANKTTSTRRNINGGVNNQNQMNNDLVWVKHLDKINSDKSTNKFMSPAYKEDILTSSKNIDEPEEYFNLLDFGKKVGVAIGRTGFNIARHAINSNPKEMQKWAINFDMALTEYPQQVNKAIRTFFGEEAAENLLMAYRSVYLNTPYARRHKVYENVDQIEDEEIRDFMKAKLNKEMGYSKMYEMKGIYIEADSSTSLKLSQNRSLHKVLSSYAIKNALILGQEVNSSVGFRDSNFHNAIGKADVIKIKMLPNGAVEMYVCDNYNFNEGENDFIIYGPRILEQVGELKPYFAIYHVIIPYYIVNRIFNI